MDLEKAFTLYLAFTLIVFSIAAFYYSENSNKLGECTNRLIEQKNKVWRSGLDSKSCNMELMECGDELNKTFNGMFNLSREVQNLTKEKKILESELKDIIRERDSYKTSLESVSEFDECEIIKNQSLKDDCFLDIIAWKKSLPEFIQLATCRIIQNQNMRDKCFTYTAIRQNKPGICAEISNKSFFYITTCKGIKIKHYYLDECYLNLALKKRDTSLCEKINNIYRNECYAKVAILTEDSGICEKITNKEDRENCIEAIKSGGCGCKVRK
ncbi:MAG: hypothetical protein B6U72_03490 [Candidatus Altiarchaeales archaeon ex4484_2]|nr:MAG: hypothetical protein B6U72_03490 [Candidatus Altiarchaeales archaeon ex4484_2]